MGSGRMAAAAKSRDDRYDRFSESYCMSSPRRFTNTVRQLTMEETHCQQFVVEPASIYPPVPEVYNWEAVKQVRQQRDLYSAAALGFGVFATVGPILFSPLALFGIAPTTATLNIIQKTAQLEQVIPTLLEAFKDEGVQVFASLDIEGQQDLDLLVRFPDKTFFAIAVRSKGESKIVFSENVDDLRVKRKSGSASNKWKPHPLQELNDQELWLRKNRRDLFGGSSRDSRRPLVKVLALWGDTKLGLHSEPLYSKIGNNPYLILHKSGTVCLLEESQLVFFIRDWRIQMQQKSDTS